MLKVIRVLETCIHVDDVERSARFYEKLFAFPRMGMMSVFACSRLAVAAS